MSVIATTQEHDGVDCFFAAGRKEDSGTAEDVKNESRPADAAAVMEKAERLSLLKGDYVKASTWMAAQLRGERVDFLNACSAAACSARSIWFTKKAFNCSNVGGSITIGASPGSSIRRFALTRRCFTPSAV